MFTTTRYIFKKLKQGKKHEDDSTDSEDDSNEDSDEGSLQRARRGRPLAEDQPSDHFKRGGAQQSGRRGASLSRRSKRREPREASLPRRQQPRESRDDWSKSDSLPRRQQTQESVNDRLPQSHQTKEVWGAPLTRRPQRRKQQDDRPLSSHGREHVVAPTNSDTREAAGVMKTNESIEQFKRNSPEQRSLDSVSSVTQPSSRSATDRQEFGTEETSSSSRGNNARAAAKSYDTPGDTSGTDQLLDSSGTHEFSKEEKTTGKKPKKEKKKKRKKNKKSGEAEEADKIIRANGFKARSETNVSEDDDIRHEYSDENLELEEQFDLGKDDYKAVEHRVISQLNQNVSSAKTQNGFPRSDGTFSPRQIAQTNLPKAINQHNSHTSNFDVHQKQPNKSTDSMDTYGLNRVPNQLNVVADNQFPRQSTQYRSSKASAHTKASIMLGYTQKGMDLRPIHSQFSRDNRIYQSNPNLNRKVREDVSTMNGYRVMFEDVPSGPFNRNDRSYQSNPNIFKSSIKQPGLALAKPRPDQPQVASTVQYNRPVPRPFSAQAWQPKSVQEAYPPDGRRLTAPYPQTQPGVIDKNRGGSGKENLLANPDGAFTSSYPQNHLAPPGAVPFNSTLPTQQVPPARPLTSSFPQTNPTSTSTAITSHQQSHLVPPGRTVPSLYNSSREEEERQQRLQEWNRKPTPARQATQQPSYHQQPEQLALSHHQQAQQQQQQEQQQQQQHHHQRQKQQQLQEQQQKYFNQPQGHRPIQQLQASGPAHRQQQPAMQPFHNNGAQLPHYASAGQQSSHKQLVEEMEDLLELSYYHGGISRGAAEELLQDHATAASGGQDGTFLVRDKSDTQHGELVLSVLVGIEVKHFVINLSPGGLYHLGDAKHDSFDRLDGLIDHLKREGINNKYKLSSPLEAEFPPPPPPLEGAQGQAVEDQWAIAEHHLKLDTELGRGRFGVVYRAVLNGSSVVAVKTVKEMTYEAVGDMQNFRREIEVLKQLRHPRLTKLIGTTQLQDGRTAIIMEFLTNGNLLEYLLDVRTWVFSLKDNKKAAFGVEVAEGMAYLESQRVVHRDLAARNILLSADMTVKIADFGLSRILQEDVATLKDGTHRPMRWMALESLLRQQFSVRSDVWSYGILLLEIYNLGEPPYSNLADDAVIPKLSAGYRAPKPKPCPQRVYDEIMAPCWADQPQHRPGFQDILRRWGNILKK